jgi:hypothetical protein
VPYSALPRGTPWVPWAGWPLSGIAGGCALEVPEPKGRLNFYPCSAWKSKMKWGSDLDSDESLAIKVVDPMVHHGLCL